MILKQFSDKAAEFAYRPPEFDKRFNVLTGSIRSSKTFQMLPKLALFLPDYDIGGERIITGVSKDTIYHNVLNDLFDLVGPSNYRYNRQSGELVFLGSKWNVVGAKDEGSEKYIRGRTIGVAYCDELTLMPQSFYLMLVGRMSVKGARLYATTNPDTPHHWVKKKILDNPDIQKELWTETYTLDDNPHLPEEYKDSVKRSYTGVYFDRFVLGRWVLASGAIYRDVFTDDLLYNEGDQGPGLRNNGGHAERLILCDYGTQNPQVYLDVYDDGDIWWVDNEYYWDAKEQRRQKTDGEYADDLIKFIGPIRAQVILDPSAASFATELLTRGIVATDADNSVDEGIRMVSTMLSRKKIKIHRRCVNTIREMQTYAWNEKAGERGVEEPIKAFDHSCDALRYGVMTKVNPWRLAV